MSANGPVLRYALGDEVAVRRARATALWRATATLLPPAMSIVLVAQMGVVARPVAALFGGLVAALAVTRALVGYRQALRRLRSFRVDLEPARLVITTVRARLAVTREQIARIVEVGGALGGLRLELTRDVAQNDDLPRRIDIPRGGAAFLELRTALAGWRPFEGPSRRGPLARVVLGAVVVLGIFFVPFFVADFVARSRMIALALVLFLWGAVRIVLSR